MHTDPYFHYSNNSEKRLKTRHLRQICQNISPDTAISHRILSARRSFSIRSSDAEPFEESVNKMVEVYLLNFYNHKIGLASASDYIKKVRRRRNVMRFKKAFMGIATVVALTALCLCGLVACSSNNTANSSSTNNVKPATTTLTVGFDQDFPPYGYVGNDGQYTGFDLELAKEVCTRNGWTFVAQPINWDAKDMELQSGTINCIWNGFTINGREDSYTWTDPYMDNSQVIVVKKSSNISSLSDLAGKTVVTQAASAALTVLEDPDGQKALASTFRKLLTTVDYNTAFMELKSGAVDAVAIDLPVAQYQTTNSNDFVILNEHLSEEQYGVGFLKGNTGLRDQVETTLKAMVADGYVEKLCAKYADQGISYENWVLK